MRLLIHLKDSAVECDMAQLRSLSAALTQLCNGPRFLKLHMLQIFICSVAERTRALQLQECKSGQRPISVLQARSLETANTLLHINRIAHTQMASVSSTPGGGHNER